MEKKKSYVVFVVAKDGTPLMPCTNPKKVRRLRKEGRARIYKHDPFTIQLLYESEKNTQSVEICEDTGYLKVGLSVKSEKHEYVREELSLLPDEKQRHMDQVKYRRQRRRRRRYRKPRFDNRKKKVKDDEAWLPPSLKHKAEAHVSRAKKYAEVLPVSSITLETTKFDTALIAALERGELLEGIGYQQGFRYLQKSLRIAVFERDNYTCQICGRNAFDDDAVLCQHHIGYRYGDRSNRPSNLLTVCTHCHTPANHKPGGKLWDLKPAGKLKADAAFMNTVRYRIAKMFRETFPDILVNTVYSAMTAAERKMRNIPKSHSNDAYAMGSFHPKHRAHERRFQKRRRNNRILEKFYDAVYIDSRDGKKKKGAELSSGRVNRNEKLSGPNLRIYRKCKEKPGRRQIRKRHYSLRPHDRFIFRWTTHEAIGMGNKGERIQYKDPENPKRVLTAKLCDVRIVRHIGGWNETD